MKTIRSAGGLLAAWLALSSGLGWAQQLGPPSIVGDEVDGATAGASAGPGLVEAGPMGPAFAPGQGPFLEGVPSGGDVYAGVPDGYYADPYGNPVESGPPLHYYYYPGFPRNWIGYVEYLNWAAHRDGLDVAWVGDFTLLPADLSVAEVQLGRDSGFRVGLGYQFASRWEFTWNYTYFFTEGNLALPASADAPVSTTQTIFFPGFLVPQGDFAFASQLRYHVHDLEFGRWFLIDEFVALRLFCGFRWAMIDQQLTQSYQNLPGAIGPASVTSAGTTSMDAYGIRLGSEGRWKLPGRWSVFGRGSASVLSGHFSRTINESAAVRNANGAVTDFSGAFADNTTQAVGVLDAAAGVSWTSYHWQLSAGYELAAWFNTGNRNVGLFGVPFPPQSTNLLLDGFFIRAAFIR